MRALIVVFAAALAGSAAAQPYLGIAENLEAQRSAEAMAVRNRDIALTNELSVMQARAQAEQAVANLQAAGISRRLPTVALDPKAPPPQIDVSQLAEIPDATLAASNARILAAANNRR